MRLVSPVLYRLGGVRAARFFLRPVRRVYAVTRWSLPYCLFCFGLVWAVGREHTWREWAVGSVPPVLGAFLLALVGLWVPQLFFRSVGRNVGWWLWPLLYVVCVWVAAVVVLGGQPELILLTLTARLDNLWRSWVVLLGAGLAMALFTRGVLRAQSQR